VSIATNVFTGAVIDKTVLYKAMSKCHINGAFISHEMRIIVDLRFDNRPQVACIDGGNVMRANMAFALYQRKNGLLASAAGSKMLSLGAMLVLFQTADERFVNLDGLAFATERGALFGEQFAHPLADAMRHEPGGTV
jgi:hypothetical protein